MIVVLSGGVGEVVEVGLVMCQFVILRGHHGYHLFEVVMTLSQLALVAGERQLGSHWFLSKSWWEQARVSGCQKSPVYLVEP